ncbi:MAG: hypothetical protein HYZ28_21145 [Myxococcales bacterium]|nr:hypothetical protein [Myxococcales bacterium]
MRAGWEALHASLMRSVRTLAAEQQFNEMKRRHEVLRAFEDPVSFVDHLHRKDGDLDEKDAVYAALVETVKAGGNGAELASSLLWLGLWPVLDRIFRRRVRLYPEAADELVSDIGDALTALIERLDVARVSRVAAWLARGTERDVVKRRRRVWADQTRRAELTDKSALGAVGPIESEDPPPRSQFGLKGDLPDEEEVAVIRRHLLPIVGDDTDLVIGAAIYGQSQRLLGERLGLTHEAARKRVQRAFERLRRHLGRPR